MAAGLCLFSAGLPSAPFFSRVPVLVVFLVLLSPSFRVMFLQPEESLLSFGCYGPWARGHVTTANWLYAGPAVGWPSPPSPPFPRSSLLPSKPETLHARSTDMQYVDHSTYIEWSLELKRRLHVAAVPVRREGGRRASWREHGPDAVPMPRPPAAFIPVLRRSQRSRKHAGSATSGNSESASPPSPPPTRPFVIKGAH